MTTDPGCFVSASLHNERRMSASCLPAARHAVTAAAVIAGSIAAGLITGSVASLAVLDWWVTR